MSRPNPAPAIYDGVAFSGVGDTALVIYASPARVERTRWLFDRIDDFLARIDGTMCALMVIMPTADFPDAATRAENDRRIKALHGKYRRVVTVVLGDGLRLNLVRTIMRGMFLANRQSHLLLVSSTLDNGIAQLLREASSHTPSLRELKSTLRAMGRELGCEDALPLVHSDSA
jgi:hypothetical protein